GKEILPIVRMTTRFCHCVQHVMSTEGDIYIQNSEIPHYTMFRIEMTTAKKHLSKQMALGLKGVK
ncbi:hypothetical protein V1389_16930, partial [Flavobacterium rakeshii]|uniref:hypothetical protein n=1 Tax=Flavobacterium rakeshii TaxID=1038845 RepID=UPI002E7AF87D